MMKLSMKLLLSLKKLMQGDHKVAEAAVEATEAHAAVEGHNEVEVVEPTEAHAAVENHSEVAKLLNMSI
jgi:hypothetical protein